MAIRSTRARARGTRGGANRRGRATARSAQAQTGFSHVYLPVNRLAWWDAAPPVSGPIQLGGRGVGGQSFDREFYSSLATVVGHDVTNDRGFAIVPIAVRLDWVGSYTVNTIRAPQVPFLVRAQAPGVAAPRFAQLALRGDTTAKRNVIVHRRIAGAGRPFSIILDFPDGQRVVGLECGFSTAQARSVNEGAFKLRAWRGDGSALVETTGADLQASDWLSNTVYRLALRDQGGDIRSIELLCDDESFVAGNELFIHSVWYEPLPPAAVRQGTIINHRVDTFTANQHPGHPDLAPDLAADPAVVPGPVIVHVATLQLPHGCDRAAVFLRGFKMIPGVTSATTTAAETPQKLAKLGVTLRPLDSPAEIARSGIFRFRLEHAMRWGEEDGVRGDALVAAYFTVVAWNSRRAELFVSEGAGERRDHRRRDVGLFEFPNRRPGVQGGFADPAATLGPLFGGARGLSLTFPYPCELQVLVWTLGLYGGLLPDAEFYEDESGLSIGDFIVGALLASGVAPAVVLLGNELLAGGGKFSARAIQPPPLGYSQQGAAIAWSWICELGDTIDSDERATSAMVGPVLGGPALRLPADRSLVAKVVQEAPSRSTAPQAFFAANGPNGTLAQAIDADMAFPVLGFFGMAPLDEIRELDVEIRAARFDGREMRFAIGGGIEVGAVGDNDDGRAMIAMPYLAGISRTPSVPRRAVSTRDLTFDWIHNLVTSAPRQPGLLRNDGNVPIGIVDIVLDSIHAHEFPLSLSHRGATIGLHEFAARGPRTLMPGAEIAFTGRFYSSTNPNPPRKRAIRRHVGSLVIRCAPPQADIVIAVSAEVIAQRADGLLLPPMVSFGNVSLPAPGTTPRWTTRRALLTSDGATPLFVRSIGFAPAVSGLIVGLESATPSSGGFVSSGALYTIDPGGSAVFAVSWLPPAAGPLDTTLTVQTNAGPRSVRVHGTAVPW